MKKLDEKGRAAACELKPTLKAEFESCSDVWELDASTTSTGRLGAQAVFIGKYRPHRLAPEPFYKIIVSTRPTSKKPDGVHTWTIEPEELGIATSSIGGRPIKYGAEEKAQAKKLREEGLSIRKIADQMNASTFTIQRLLKD